VGYLLYNRMNFPVPCSYQSLSCVIINVSQLFPPRDHLCFCGRQDSASPLETDENHPVTDCSADINATSVKFFSYKIKHLNCDGNYAEKWKDSIAIEYELLLLELKLKNPKYMYYKLIFWSTLAYSNIVLTSTSSKRFLSFILYDQFF
jgi:hypothetical protein